MSKSRTEVLEDSKKNAIKAGVVAAGSVALAVVHLPVLATVAAIPATMLVFKWWRHRVENGIRF